MNNIVKRLREVAETDWRVSFYSHAISNAIDSATEAADTIASLQRRVAELERALALVLPLAKGYASTHQVGSNAEYVREAEAAIKEKP